MKKLSIIIVTYKSENDIYECLDSIWTQCDVDRQEVEVIVVDNSPECEPMFSKLRDLYGEDIVLIHNTHNGGYGQGNNVGIRQSSAPVILIMNPDVRLVTPFFKAPLEAFMCNDRLVMYGARQMLTHEVPSHYSFMCTYMMNGYLRTIVMSLCNRLGLYIPRLHYFSGSCFFVRKEMFEAVGLFDESVFMYGEEDDIHYRLMHRFGAHFQYDKTLRYLHLIKDRQPDADYEMKCIKVGMQQNAKKGYPRLWTLKNFQRIYRLLSWMEWVKVKMGRNDAQYHMLQDLLSRIKQLKHEEGKSL